MSGLSFLNIYQANELEVKDMQTTQTQYTAENVEMTQDNSKPENDVNAKKIYVEQRKHGAIKHPVDYLILFPQLSHHVNPIPL